MAPISRVLLATLALCLSDIAVAVAVAGDSLPTAIKKQHPDSSEKIHLRDLGFAPLPRLAPARLNTSDVETGVDGTGAAPGDGVLRRAAEALALLQRRTSCPVGMTSCDDIGSPDKCCPAGTYCTAVQDQSVGHVACCPDGATCGGGVGSCPAGAASCAAELGGGCCIPGYVCQGIGCVPGESATATAPPPTQTQTITTTQTTIVAGSPTTVIVTLTITQTAAPPTFTRTETQIVTAPAAGPSSGASPGHSSATGVPPWRPTAVTTPPATPIASITGTRSSSSSSSFSSSSSSTSTSSSSSALSSSSSATHNNTGTTTSITSTTGTQTSGTQTGCPTGFYGCSAVHGGGCCRTERDCGVLSCPVPSSTIITHGVTVVVPASDVPASATSTCAGGWFLCGSDAGPVAGCCPSGWACGTASCFAKGASSTSQVQKDAPAKNAAARGFVLDGQALNIMMGSLSLLLAVFL